MTKDQLLDATAPAPTAPSAAEVAAFADFRLGAIATHAYLGDVSASPTGDKKAE